jgi:hypothetical protein
MTSGDASESGSIVTASRRVEQKERAPGDGESRCGGEGARSF